MSAGKKWSTAWTGVKGGHIESTQNFIHKQEQKRIDAIPYTER